MGELVSNNVNSNNGKLMGLVSGVNSSLQIWRPLGYGRFEEGGFEVGGVGAELTFGKIL